jgi:hypothetical protein
MKNLILTAAMIMGLSSANFATANDHIFRTNIAKSDLKVTAIEGLKFKVSANNLSQGAMLIIKSNSGDILYKTALNDLSYSKVFDLSSLPDGNYSWVVTSKGENTVKEFEIKTETVRKASNL